MGIVDFHNHLVPGVDDGAQTPAEAAAAIAVLMRDGVSAAVATPHVNASITERPAEFEQRMAELDTAFEILQECAEAAGGFRVERGVELLLDVPAPDLSDPRLRLAGGQFFLMEFPSMMVPPQSTRVIRALAEAGYTPIIAHPERYYGISANLEIAGEWRTAGARLQVNGGSLLGRYGADPRRAALELLRRGWADYLCSDYHARGPALVADYAALLGRLGAAEQARTLMETNPGRLLEGNLPLPVQPLRLKTPSLWSRVAAVFKT